MCGIVGCIADENVSTLLTAALERLQYRGYDSAGIAIIDRNDTLRVVKKKGKINELVSAIKACDDFSGNIGIGHTRWATHGKADDTNAHPHVSGDIAVVHNGIINNHLKLKAKLEALGYVYKSQTDTETISHLVNYHYAKNGKCAEDAVLAAACELVGDFAIAVVFEHENKIVAYSRRNPLVVGLCDNKNVVASDCVAILPITRQIIRLTDNQMAVVELKKVTLYSCNVESCTKEEAQANIEEVLWDIDAAEKGGYTHFMLKEIMEQPEAIRRTVNAYINSNDKIDFGFPNSVDEYLKIVENIYIVGCGSAYHAGVVGCTIAENALGLNIRTYLASEFMYTNPMINDKTLVVAISQSGETADTARAVEYARSKGAKVFSILNVVGSSISAKSDYCVYTHAGPEIAVATTKAYSAQLVVLYMLTAYIASLRNINCDIANNCVSALLALPDKISLLLNQKDLLLLCAAKYKEAGSVFFIGRNLDYALSLEGSLKLKEISYIHSEAYAAGELKHGTISLVEDGTLVIALCTCTHLIEKMTSSIQEVASRKAKVIAIVKESDLDHITALEGAVSDVIVLPDADEFVQPSLAIIPLQLFSYYVALIRNCSIDTPRNLAKSVTVE